MASLQQKHNNPLNSSTSKQQFSFNKTSRFKNHIQTQGSDSFYQIHNIKKNIAYSFGNSTRYQFEKNTKDRKCPSPFSYDIHGDIQKLLQKKDGIKFSYGRQQCKSGNIFKTSDIPGPGQYNPNPQAIQKRIGKDFSMGKIPTSKRLVQGAILPGPGAYSINSLILNQNKVLSKQTKKSYGKIIFPKIKTQRIRTEPNPSFRLPEVTYRGEKLIQNRKGFSLSKSPRFKLKHIADLPGPGTYQKFSEFIESTKK